MKNLTLLFVVLFSLSINSSIFAYKYEHLPKEKVFFYDPESKLIFIDFSALEEVPTSLKIIGVDGSAVIYATSDLSSQTMFELNLQKFDKGAYLIAIEQANQPILKQSVDVRKDMLDLSFSSEKRSKR